MARPTNPVVSIKNSSSINQDHWSPDPDFGGRAVHILEFDRPASGADEPVTAQAIALMQQLAARDATTPQLKAAAIDVFNDLAGGSHSYGRLCSSAGQPRQVTARQIADAIFHFAKRTVRYVHEEAMHTPFADFRDFLYDQTLIAPAALLTMPQPEGDCVDFSMLTMALCQIFGVPASYKTVAADPDSDAYSHVYVVCVCEQSDYVLDTSNGPGPGFEFNLPRGRKSKVWPNPKGNAAVITRSSYRRRGRIGDAGDGGDVPIIQSIDFTSPDTAFGSGGSSWQLPVSSASPSSGGGLTSLFSTIANDATKIAAPIIRQQTIQAPYYIAGANGAQILYDPSTGRTVNAGTSAFGSTFASGGSPLLIGLIVLAAAFAFAKK